MVSRHRSEQVQQFSTEPSVVLTQRNSLRNMQMHVRMFGLRDFAVGQ